MKAVDVYWTNKMNILIVECDCGKIIHHELRHSLVTCKECRKVQWYSQEFEAFNNKYTNVDTIDWSKFNRDGVSQKK